MAGSAAPTRAAQFCSGFLEAGWLVALVVVPLYYNPFSAGMFEYDTTAVLRALALLMLAAWLALQAARNSVLPAWQQLRETPLLAPVAVPNRGWRWKRDFNGGQRGLAAGFPG